MLYVVVCERQGAHLLLLNENYFLMKEMCVLDVVDFRPSYYNNNNDNK